MCWKLSAAMLVSLLLAGCGGGQGPSGSKMRFIVAADEICSRFPAPPGQSDVGVGSSTLTAATRVFADEVQRGVALLRRLPLPRGSDRAGAQAVIDSLGDVDSAAVRLDVAAARLAAHDPTQVDGVGARIEQIAAAATDLNRDVDASNRLGRAFGLRACARTVRPRRATAKAPDIAPEPDLPKLDVAPPQGVSRARRQQFREGRRVVLQAGCLACHVIAGQGNGVLGGDLSDVGSRLPRAVIAATLRSPVVPMPSYRALPSKALRALVAFLVALRAGTFTEQQAG